MRQPAAAQPPSDLTTGESPSGSAGVRLNTAARPAKRRSYLDTVFAAIPAEPFTREIGQIVARIDAEARMNGIVIPFADLLIGGTALHFGYGLVTHNERHFRMIP